MRAVWQQERHDGKLCGTEEQAQPSIRSSCGRLWRGDKTHQLSYSLSRWHWTRSGLPLTVCTATTVYNYSQSNSPYHFYYCVLDSLCLCTSSFTIQISPRMQTEGHACFFVLSWVHWWSKDKRQADNYRGGSSLAITRSAGIYLIRLVCAGLTLVERHFNSVTLEEKPRDSRFDYRHGRLLDGFSHWSNCSCVAGGGPLWWRFMYVAAIPRSVIDAARQDSIMTVSLFDTLSWRYIMILASFYEDQFSWRFHDVPLFKHLPGAVFYNHT